MSYSHQWYLKRTWQQSFLILFFLSVQINTSTAQHGTTHYGRQNNASQNHRMPHPHFFLPPPPPPPFWMRPSHPQQPASQMQPLFFQIFPPHPSNNNNNGQRFWPPFFPRFPFFPPVTNTHHTSAPSTTTIIRPPHPQPVEPPVDLSVSSSHPGTPVPVPTTEKLPVSHVPLPVTAPMGNPGAQQQPISFPTQSAQPPTSPGASIPEEQLIFAREGLAAHNELRRRHSSPPMELDPDLVKDCLSWAIRNANLSTPEHSGQKDRGENIFFASGYPNVPGRLPVEDWYNEIKDYSWNHPENPDVAKTGHFTAVVWKSSQRMGMAWAKGGHNNIVVVAQYKPPGNTLGGNYYRENVLPALKTNN